VDVYKLSDLGKKERDSILLRKSSVSNKKIKKAVERVIKRVEKDGDQALFDLAIELDGVRLNSLKVSRKDLKNSSKSIDQDLKDVLDRLIDRLIIHHKNQGQSGAWYQEEIDGLITGERTLPIEKVCLYVPNSKGSFPSVTAMLAVPASLAGVKEIIICSPPNKDGQADPASLYSANKLGIKDFYLIGGAAAVAAVSFGTKTIPKVDKIIGPGNLYFQEAKRRLAHLIDVGPAAGPSEAVIIADKTARVDTLAHELLVEAEHGSDSTVLMLTTSKKTAEAVASKVGLLIKELPNPRKKFVKNVFKKPVIIYSKLNKLIDFSNQFAPEHLRLITKDDQAVYSKIINAGEVLIGPYSSISLGNYGAGVNAVLPTAGFAKTASCLRVDDFLKTSSYLEVKKEAAKDLASDAVQLADLEGFVAHMEAAKNLSDEV
jgi:histidinol dehydrogenase